MKTKNFIAFDIGASNGRCIAGEYDGQILRLEIVKRFDTGYFRVGDHLYSNILGIWGNMIQSLAKAANEIGKDMASIGVDTWAVDFGLLDEKGELIGNPYFYRDPQTEGMMAEAFKIIPREELFQITGIQFMSLNTLYQLLAMARAGSPRLRIAKTFLMIPDLLNYWMSGRVVCEYTNASTTQLLNARKRAWDDALIEKIGIPAYIFPELIEPGQRLGELYRTTGEETGLAATPIVSVGTHDTASAVAAVPAETQSFAYISSGTWGLMGTETAEAVLDEKVYRYNFGNEGGVCGTIRLLRNIVNLWLLQECRRIWALEGQRFSWADLIQMAEAAEPFGCFIDPDDPSFLIPERMPAAIQEYCRSTGQAVPGSKGEILRACHESLAFKYRYTLEKLADIQGKKPEVLHIVGGGSQNRLLCQQAANAIQRPVIAGPSEATALGNLILQMMAVGEIANLEEGRKLISASYPAEVFLPKDGPAWEEQYHRYLEVTGLPPIF